MESENFYRRAHESRDRLAEESGLSKDPEKYARLKSAALEIQHDAADTIRSTATAAEFGSRLDEISQKLQALFPRDPYGEAASTYFLKRGFEKTRDEVGDWLIAQGRQDLAGQLQAAAATWRTAEEAGLWLDQNVLSQFSDPALFGMARDTKITEAENYYLSQKGS